MECGRSGAAPPHQASDLPAPETGKGPEESSASSAKVVPPPEGALPKVPSGFSVEVLAKGFKQPRTPVADYSSAPR